MTTLKTLRIGSRETQQQIADLLGITRAAYTNIENGKRGCDSDTLKTLARHFDVSTDYILGLAESVPSSSLLFESDEIELIKKYRKLSAHGKKIVDILLEEELEYAQTLPQPTRIAARGGGIEDRPISDKEAKRLLQLPEVEEF